MKTLGIISILRRWNDSIRLIENEASPTARMFLLRLDPRSRELSVFQFHKDKIDEAQLMYADFERKAESDPTVNVVLVSADDLAALRKAYPNYYLDTKGFLAAIQKAVEK